MTRRRTSHGEAGGLPLERIVIGDPAGFHAVLLSFGASLVELHAPGRDGYADVALGHERIEDYLAIREYLGATCGRFANRIGHARFRLDGREWALEANEGSSSLHGGPGGFDRHNWAVETAEEDGAVFRRLSPDGEGGYPGALATRVAYRVSGTTLTIEATATCDRPTVVNIVNHAYWNLHGHGAGEAMRHRLRIHAGRVVAVDERLVPTGELLPVAGTPYDFGAMKPVGRDAAATALDGYDTCFYIDGERGVLRPMASLVAPEAGRRLDVSGTEAGLQFYTAEHLDGSLAGKGGARYGRRAGIALEAQNWPDAPNHEGFPSARLDPGETYRNRVELAFTAV